MKTYKVLIAWEGVNVGDLFEKGGFGEFNYVIKENGIELMKSPLLQKHEIAILLRLGFIEEVGSVKKEKFEPRQRQQYWFITADGNVTVEWYDSPSDVHRYRIGNCYRTEMEALEARERVLNAY